MADKNYNAGILFKNFQVQTFMGKYNISSKMRC